jgi:hypothetical protein
MMYYISIIYYHLKLLTKLDFLLRTMANDLQNFEFNELLVNPPKIT